MTIFSVIRRRVKSASRIESTIHFFSPSYENCLAEAKILASRYKRRYMIQAQEFDKTGTGIQVSALTFVRCAGKGQPIIVENC